MPPKNAEYITVLSFPVNIIYRNTETDNKVAICKDPDKNNNLFKLDCKISTNNTNQITQIKFSEEFTLGNLKLDLSTLAIASKKNIISNVEPRLSSGDIEVLENAGIDKKSGLVL